MREFYRGKTSHKRKLFLTFSAFIGCQPEKTTLLGGQSRYNSGLLNGISKKRKKTPRLDGERGWGRGRKKDGEKNPHRRLIPYVCPFSPRRSH